MNAVHTWCPVRTAPTPHAVRTVAVACVTALMLAVGAGCGGPKEQTASQVAARVNKQEVTVHQINHALQTMRGLKPEQAEVASGRILERLIDQELAIQKAQSLKLDRDPRVLQQIEAARNEVVARAYFDKIADGVSRPTPEEITAYYNDNPALFRERRIYQLQEVAIQAKGPQVEAIKRIVGAGKPLEDVLIHLRSNKIEYASNQVVRAAEQIPLATLPALSKLKSGQGIVIEGGAAGIQVISVVESRPQAIDEERARPAIEQFMVNDRKRRVVADDLKALRAAAKVEYVGKFAASAPAAGDVVPSLADAAASAARGLPPSAAPAPAPAAAAKAAIPAADAAASAPEGALENTIINKGLGLKK